MNSPQKRKSQIKVRLKKKNEDLTEQDISIITRNVYNSRGISYNYGSTRGNYVSHDGLKLPFTVKIKKTFQKF